MLPFINCVGDKLRMCYGKFHLQILAIVGVITNNLPFNYHHQLLTKAKNFHPLIYHQKRKTFKYDVFIVIWF